MVVICEPRIIGLEFDSPHLHYKERIMSEQGKILHQLIDEDFGIEHDTGDYYRAIKHDSLVLNFKDGIFYWNSKDIAGGVREYYKYVRNQKPPEKFLIPKPDLSPGEYTVTRTEEVEVKPFGELVGAYWKAGQNHRDYWYRRLLKDSTIDRFQLGYSDGWYTIPIYKDGEFYNIQFRRDEPEKGISQRYRRPPFLFNSRILSSPMIDEVIFTEGIVDAILLSQMGFPAVSKNTGAGGWSSGWIWYFRYISKIYMFFDNDDAGRLGMAKGFGILGEHRCKGYTFDSFSKGYDVIDFFRDGHTKDDFEDLFNLVRTGLYGEG